MLIPIKLENANRMFFWNIRMKIEQDFMGMDLDVLLTHISRGTVYYKRMYNSMFKIPDFVFKRFFWEMDMNKSENRGRKNWILLYTGQYGVKIFKNEEMEKDQDVFYMKKKITIDLPIDYVRDCLSGVEKCKNGPKVKVLESITENTYIAQQDTFLNSAKNPKAFSCWFSEGKIINHVVGIGCPLGHVEGKSDISVDMFGYVLTPLSLHKTEYTHFFKMKIGNLDDFHADTIEKIVDSLCKLKMSMEDSFESSKGNTFSVKLGQLSKSISGPLLRLSLDVLQHSSS
jgi:hypothetical protein